MPNFAFPATTQPLPYSTDLNIAPQVPLPADRNTYDADTIMKNRDLEQRGNITRYEDV
jgi:hypothetical protein